MKGFKDWLVRNGFDPMDRQYNFGYHEIGQVDILNSFGTTEHEDVWAIMNNHLDIYRIETPEVTATYDYAWADPDYYQQQIERLKAGYDYSSRG